MMLRIWQDAKWLENAVVVNKVGGGGTVAYWEDMLEHTVNHAQWKRLLDADSVEWIFMKSQATRDHLRKDYDAIRGLLVELGMVKSST